MKREFPESQPKYAQSIQIPIAGTGRMRSPYPKADGNWYFVDESTEKPLIPFRTFRSAELPYVNGGLVNFTLPWDNFNPATDFYQVQVYGLCTQSQAGYQVGDRVLLNGRRCTATVTSTAIVVRVGGNGISIGRQNGNLNEVSLNSGRWLIYVQAFSSI